MKFSNFDVVSAARRLERNALAIGIALAMPFPIMLMLMSVPSIAWPSLSSRYVIGGLTCLGVMLITYVVGEKTMYYDVHTRKTMRVVLENKTAWALMAGFAAFAAIAFYKAAIV